MSILDDVYAKVKNVKDNVSSTASEYRGMGSEMKAKGSQLATPKATTAPAAPAAKPVDSGKRYGDKPGEKRLDANGDEIKSYKRGTNYVPKTGLAMLHEGEKVVPKEKNMDAKTAMEGITGKKGKPEKKIKEIRTKVTDDGKYVHTHLHHHPAHHADETHVSNTIEDAQAHMAEQAPNMSAQEPAMPEAGGAGAPPPAAGAM
jgi:hypothetical protein